MASQLSPRQREILDLVAEGRTSKEIAVALGISESTVNWHLANVFTRLGASSRAEAVALAMRSNGGEHVTTPPPPAARPSTPHVPRAAWPRLVAIAIAIAIVGALLGGATVATLRPTPIGPTQQSPTSPADSLDPNPSARPASGVHQDVAGGGGPADGAMDVATEPATPETLVPATSAPALTTFPAPLPLPVPTALPSAPVALPPAPSLPIPPLPLPTAGPTTSLPLP